MSHTNETPNYGLPQYVGTDILNPLVDTNDAYEKIDTALKNIADEVVSDSSKIDALERAVGDSTSGLVKDVADLKLQNGDTSLSTTAQTLSGAINEINGKVDTVEVSLMSKAENSDVLALGNRVTAVEGEVANINNDLIIISASYGLSPSASVNFITSLKLLLATSFDNIYDKSISGAGFANGNFLAAIQSLDADITNKNSVKKILVVGNANDMNYTWDDVLTAMQTFNTYCNVTYPNATVVIAPVSTRTSNTDVDALRTLYANMCNTITSHKMAIMSSAYHILALDYTAYMSGDGIHPNSAGADIIAEALYCGLIGEKYDNHKIVEDTVTTGGSDSRVTVSYNVTDYDLNSEEVNISTHIAFTVSEEFTIPLVFGQNLALVKCDYIKPASYYNRISDIGMLIDETDSKAEPVRIGVAYNSTIGGYCIGILSGYPTQKLTNGHNYRIRATLHIPFNEI